MDDFNEVFYQWEKVGRREVDNYRLAAFQDFLNECSLMDLESKGCSHRLESGRTIEREMRWLKKKKKRLDRVVCNID